ncbi:MAG: hypothetical protein KIT84_43285 [Labilithrix sp.]|nr:hypothetical protein [Labilithrix sp.]MCW5817902.1 hypothetical protein [Labilithrix sp.]
MRACVFACVLVAACVEPAATPARPVATVAPVRAPPEDCDAGHEIAAAPAGPKPPLPAVPDIQDAPARDGDVFSVAAAIHALRSAVESAELARGPITIEGYIIDTNLARAPKCAIHRAGVRDPAGCDAELPAFTLGDRRGQAPGANDVVRVMGWASSHAQVFEARQQGGRSYVDALWGIELPSPLPAVGAKVRVTGRYAETFSKSSRGVVTDRYSGILTYESMTVLD